MLEVAVTVALLSAALLSVVTVEHLTNEAVAVADVCVAVDVNTSGVELEVRVVEEVTEVAYFLFNLLLLFVCLLLVNVVVVYGANAIVSTSLARLVGITYVPIRSSFVIVSERLSVDDSVAVAVVLYDFKSDE